MPPLELEVPPVVRNEAPAAAAAKEKPNPCPRVVALLLTGCAACRSRSVTDNEDRSRQAPSRGGGYGVCRGTDYYHKGATARCKLHRKAIGSYPGTKSFSFILSKFLNSHNAMVLQDSEETLPGAGRLVIISTLPISRTSTATRKNRCPQNRDSISSSACS